MTCHKVQQQLADYVVGGLGRWPRLRIGRHLRACTACRAEVAALRRTGEVMSGVPLASAPADTWESVRRHVQSSVRRRAPRPVFRLAAVGALALLVLVLGVVFRDGGTPPPQVGPTQIADVGAVEVQRALEGHLSAVYSAPLSDPAAVGLRLETLEEGMPAEVGS